MKILYNNQDGKIFYAVPDKELFWFTHSTNIPLLTFEIDEVDPINKDICLDLRRTAGRVDETGEGKYYLSGGVLMEKEGWTEYNILEGF